MYGLHYWRCCCCCRLQRQATSPWRRPGSGSGVLLPGCARPSKQLALTYDDGPNDPHTLRLLDVLARHNVRATFFLIGRYVQQRPDIVRELVKAGHVIGNHTFTHPLLTFQSCDRAAGRVRWLQTSIGRCGRRAFEPFPSAVWREAASGVADCAPDGAGAHHVECDGIRLEARSRRNISSAR